ncbi:MAG TPA: DUF5680 domain-containing protein [Steroidobacteraceae bacterium]|nr:DUF5680 domain-containing protein [Steroidobacteraceae bacterium]
MSILDQDFLYFLRVAKQATYASEGNAARVVYRALRAALTATPAELPVRGPTEFQFDGLRYVCAIHGAIERFRGTELITGPSGNALYDLDFSGGQLS